jgi:hypothetical protein
MYSEDKMMMSRLMQDEVDVDANVEENLMSIYCLL